MHEEAGERPDFLPALVGLLSNLGPERIVIERGYGSKIGFSATDYASLSRMVKFTSLPECFFRDVGAVLRWPEEELIRSMRPASVLVTIAHLPTPPRVALLRQLGLCAASASIASGTTWAGAGSRT